MKKQARQPKDTSRWYDTTDPQGSSAAAYQCGLETERVENLGDQSRILLRGSVAAHQKFMDAEGYAKQEWERPTTQTYRA